MELKDKIAVVTGGSSGIGQAIAVALSLEGCRIIFTYNSGEKGADGTLKQIPDGEKYHVNLDNHTEVAGLFKFIEKKYGKIDILVNSAGIEVSANNQLDINAWQRTFETDMFWMVRCTDSALPIMNDAARILNVSSEYADEWMGTKVSIAYSAAKAAVNSFTRTLAKLLAPKILVNAISPGYVDTPMWKTTTEPEKKALGKDQLIERFIRPEEIAQMAVAIIKNDAMTGEVVVVDGGLSLKTV